MNKKYGVYICEGCGIGESLNIAKLGEADPRVVALDADVKNSTFSDKFEKKFPERFYQNFIAEQVMVGAAMGLAARGEEEGAMGVRDARLFPFAGEHVGPFIGVRMRVGRNCAAGFELAQHHDASGGFILVQQHQLNAGIRSGLPHFVFGQCDVGKHEFTDSPFHFSFAPDCTA